MRKLRTKPTWLRRATWRYDISARRAISSMHVCALLYMLTYTRQHPYEDTGVGYAYSTIFHRTLRG